MGRKEDLENHIFESYDIILQYEQIIQTSDRPEETARARWKIDEQWELIKDYLDEYIALCERLQVSITDDLIDIVARFPDYADHYNREPIESRYVTYLRRQYGHVPLGGIAPRVQGRVLSIPLDELFVPLQAEPNAPLQAQFVMSGVRGFQAVRAPDPRLVGLDEIMAQPHVVILGEPGAGKSTLLRWLVARRVKSADGSREDSLSPDAYPVFIRLASFAAGFERQPGLSLAQYLREGHLPEISIAV